jgi:hypothetical protein
MPEKTLEQLKKEAIARIEAKRKELLEFVDREIK